MELEGWNVAICSSAEDVVRNSDLLITVTTTRTPIVKAEWIAGRKNMHITCIGADSPGKGEMDVSIPPMADFLCTDAKVQTIERGEFQHAYAAGTVALDKIMEIGELIERPELHRQDNDDRLTMFDTSGVAVEDIMITKFVYTAVVGESKSKL
jgi:ornithine cyclodeaminase/alanine dehydrogenase-like protein (mu-crystallin family)